MTTTSDFKGSPNDDHSSNDSHSKESKSSHYAQEDEDDPFTFRSRKSYPQRNNRPKLNYRDLERGVYDAHELRQSQWAMGGPSVLNKNNRNGKNNNHTEYSDPEDDEDEAIGEEDNDQSSDETEQMHRRLWCICKKPWDHSRLMLRCDTCANWYHGDCIGVTKEQARVLDMNGDQFVCPPCKKGTTNPTIKSGRSSDESIVSKRKRIDAVSPSDRRATDRHETLSTSRILTHSEPSKRPKSGIFFQRDSSKEPQIHCTVHGCTNWAKSGWVYCSTPCIRRHINDTLQMIQRSKGTNNENPPSREDILLYESRTKKVLDQKLVPKVEDLCTWINHHPSYEIVKPALRQSILLTANGSKSSPQPNFIRSPSIASPKTPTTPTTPTSVKPKLSWASVVPNSKPVPIRKAPVQLGKPTNNPSSSSATPNYADIRVKVPQALYDKLVSRLEKSGEKLLSNDEIRVLVDKIEEEMYRVYGKVDNAYKNKFRSLLANITNMNNNFFYKHILSKEVTAKQIVAMKPEDMLPPEEKEKRKDEFEKEVQMIIQAGEQTAEEMARRARTKNTRQGLIDNDTIGTQKQPNLNEEKNLEHKNSETKKAEKSNLTSKSIVKQKKTVSTTIDQKPKTEVPTLTSDKDTISSEDRPIVSDTPVISKSPSPVVMDVEEPIPSLPEKPVAEPVKLPYTSPIREEPNPTYASVDLDNDYIEPESPTGIDALLYDDDDDLNNPSTHSRTSSITSHPQSPAENPEYPLPMQSTIRDDYNPLAASKQKTEPTPSSRSIPQWRGAILPQDTKIPCQSVRVYGESDYLVGDIPEQLGILGRLRLGDLWDYIRDSLPVRDVIILSVTSSDSGDNLAFSRYVDTMRSSGRAAVITKRTEPSVIRDMYVLAADIKDCPSNVLSTLALPTNIDSKQLFLVVIGSGRRSNKTSNRPTDNQSSSHLTYKPISLHDPTIRRDPRLSKNKDPRLIISDNTPIIPPSQPVHTVVIPEDNLTEENMEVDEEQEDKNKKQSLMSEFNDIDYRFMDQDIDHRIGGIFSINDERKDVFDETNYSTNNRDADDRTVKSNIIKDPRGNDSDFRRNDIHRISPR